MFEQNNQQNNSSKNAIPNADINDVLSTVRDISRRLRILEERYTNIRKNIQVNEENMLKGTKENLTEFKTTNMEISEIKKTIRSFGEDMKQIIKELKSTVKKDEVKVLERYINLWQPMEFVTHEEMENRLKVLLNKHFESKGL